MYYLTKQLTSSCKDTNTKSLVTFSNFQKLLFLKKHTIKGMPVSSFTITGANTLAIITPMGLPKIKNN